MGILNKMLANRYVHGFVAKFSSKVKVTTSFQQLINDLNSTYFHYEVISSKMQALSKRFAKALNKKYRI